MRASGGNGAHLENVELLGLFLLSFARACVNLHALVGSEFEPLLAGVEPMGWVSASRFMAVRAAITRRYRDFEPILERIGIEMMKLWYEQGPGRSVVTRAVDFLHYQTGSSGYSSVVRGPAEHVGSFTLVAVDLEEGSAVVCSTTPFDRAMERGVLIGGLQAAGDTVYVDVDNSADPDIFQIRLH